MNHLDLPRIAIDSFEKTTKLSVTLHSLDARIWTMLPPARFWHTAAVCRAAKRVDESACLRFDQTQVQAELARRPGGFLKICHAGVVEWVVGAGWFKSAVDGTSRPRLVLFAGHVRDSEALDELSPLRSSQRSEPMTAGHDGSLPKVTLEQAHVCLEMLRQLGARFEQWLGSMEGPAHSPGAGHVPAADRRRWIEGYIQTHHMNAIDIGGLARRLGVSDSRAAHIVRQACGQSFGQLVTDARVRTAASLLSHTGLPVLDIALRSGFGDVSNFHRRFKQRLGLTPLQYRKRVEVLTPLTLSV